jgi:hypothetical protein
MGSQAPSDASVGPLVVGEQAITAGRGKHKHVVGFQIDFNGPLNAQAAQNPANYSVVRQVMHGRKLVSHHVAFRALYNSATDSVQLTLNGPPKFSLGGRIVVNATSPGTLASASQARPAHAAGGTPAATITITVLPGALGFVG